MDKLTIRDIEVTNKTVLVRADLDVPLDEETGEIINDNCLVNALPTVRYLLNHDARVILCGHLGYPGGRVVEKLRFNVVARRLSTHLHQEVQTTSSCIGQDVQETVKALRPGDILLLENLRFYPDEENNDSSFAEALSRMADIFVNDCFENTHQEFASTVGISNFLPSVAGFLLEKELANLGGLLRNPVRPFTILLGGNRLNGKIPLIMDIIDSVDCLFIGGNFAATFLKADGYEIGQSFVETDKLEAVCNLMEKAMQKGMRVILPEDVVVADVSGIEFYTVLISDIPHNLRIVDLGPRSIEKYSRELSQHRTIFWNGPLGICEIPRFARATEDIAHVLAGLEARIVVGGDFTTETVNRLKLSEMFTFTSSGSSATLSFIGRKPLPAVEALLSKTTPHRAKPLARKGSTENLLIYSPDKKVYYANRKN